jgi:hypothetical protein
MPPFAVPTIGPATVGLAQAGGEPKRIERERVAGWVELLHYARFDEQR